MPICTHRTIWMRLWEKHWVNAMERHLQGGYILKYCQTVQFQASRKHFCLPITPSSFKFSALVPSPYDYRPEVTGDRENENDEDNISEKESRVNRLKSMPSPQRYKEADVLFFNDGASYVCYYFRYDLY